ncbi:ABC transporter ATP-binding protein [Archaeoglobus neptunius]|uniref:ABC transporter ATP-binding protein n=1 Tax=Archaeoglobus neptunius TaxID=2798580 RepID=UPI0019261856|nr:ABC transporter ATP-binding protein [Archaeoglobus neptunius]
MHAIEIEGVTKCYGEFKALDDLTLHVEMGDVFGFLGPNGAGKTTTINAALGLIRPDSGNIRILGIDVEEKPVEVKKVCGYLPENYGFYDNLSAMQNLTYYAEFYGIRSRDYLQELLAMVGLENAAEKKLKEFSRGMRQRLALAQALINDPEVVFLDEPTNGLDPSGIADFRRIIRNLNRDGKTIFFSSHILAEVREVCRSIGIISKGRLLKTGRIDKLNSKMSIIVQTEPQADESLLREFGDVSFDEQQDAFVIDVERDCRVEISKRLFESGYIVKELHLREPTLEEVYFSIVG